MKEKEKKQTKPDANNLIEQYCIIKQSITIKYNLIIV